MPTDLTALLLATAVAARSAQERPVPRQVPPSREQIDAVLEGLPAAVTRALDTDRAAHLALLMDAETLPQCLLAAEVMRELTAHAVETRHTDGKLWVGIPSLLAAAELLSMARALAAVAETWRAVAGPSSTFLHDAHAGTLTLTALGGRHVVAPGWPSRPPSEVVEEARLALGLPAWQLAAVAEAWAARAGAAATVVIERGVFAGGRFFPASAVGAPGAAGATLSALLFTLRPGVEAAAYAMTSATAEASVDALIERAARDLGVPARGAVQVPTGVRAEGKRSLRTPPLGLT